MSDVNIKVNIVSKGAQSSIRALSRQTNALEKDINGVNIGIKNTTSAFKVFSGVLGAQAFVSGIRNLTTAITSFSQSAIQAASDAEETFSKFSVVFQDVGDEAEKASQRLITSFGLSRTEAKSLLAATGDLLTGFGFSGEAALGLSQQVQELAVDLASFTNFSGGAEGASAALTKALLGERESIKSLGIAIREEDVQRQVAINTAKGLTFATEAQAKAQATLDLAIQQSKNAIGDFSRTQDSFANQQRIAAAAIEDISVLIGQEFLPIVTDILSTTIDWIRANEGLVKSFAVEAAQLFSAAIGVLGGAISSTVTLVQEFNQFLNDNSEALTAATVAVGIAATGIAAYNIAINATAIATGIAAAATTGFTAALAFLTSPITLTVAAVAALGAGVFLLAKNWDTVKAAVLGFAATTISSLLPALDATLTGLSKFVGIFSSDFAASIDSAKQSIRDLVVNLEEEKAALEANALGAEAAANARIAKDEEIIKSQQERISKAKELGLQEIANDIELQAMKDEINEQRKTEEAEQEAAANEQKMSVLQANLQKENEIKAAARDENIKDIVSTEKEKEKEEKKEVERKFRQGKAIVAAAIGFKEEELRATQDALSQTATLTSSSNKTLFRIGKAAAIANATISGIAAVQNALKDVPYPFNFAAAALVGVATAANISKISAQQAPSFQTGGIVPGNSITGDRVQANLNSGEMVLNRAQQSELLGIANGTQTGAGQGTREIVVNTTVELDGETVARAVSRQVADGFELGEVV